MTLQQPSELARIFYRKIQQIHSSTEYPNQAERLPILFKSINQLFILATKEEKIKFADLGTRIAFVGHKFSIPKQSLYYIYAFRKNYFKYQFENKKANPLNDIYLMGLIALTESIKGLTKIDVPNELNSFLPNKSIFKKEEVVIKKYAQYKRVLLIKDDPEKETFTAIDEDYPLENVFIRYNIIGRNDSFTSTVQLIRKVFGFPLSVNLLDVEIDEQGVYRPQGFVVLPDYLIDITSISECFSHQKIEPKKYLLKKFIPVHQNKYLSIGNIANYFLDELMSGNEQGFKELFSHIFTQNPIGFSTMEDSEIREIYHQSHLHYTHLIDTIQRDFPEQNLNATDSYLEPSFYSKEYGIQGRLDLWSMNEDGKASIVELKSGKPYMPNKQGLSLNHYTQTLLYDLLVKSVYGKKINPTNFILYSKLEQSRLRFAQVSKPHQMEAMKVRNQLLAIEMMLTEMSSENYKALQLIHPNRCMDWKGFDATNLTFFNKHYFSLDDIEKKYFYTMIGFIAREHFTAKIGASKNGNIAGQANLWAKALPEKRDDFEVLNQLELHQFPDKEDEPVLIFHKSQNTSKLANFRLGDICVLYPFINEKSTVLSHQIFKCTIIGMDKNSIHIRLRAKQLNDKLFRTFKHWNLEHDLYDSSYNNQYKELLSFASQSKEKRDLFLTRIAPSKPSNNNVIPPEEMTNEQKDIFIQLVNQGNLFLLWGPPGTGKTNMMLKHLVGYLFDHSQENILLLTYTNRAADEICQSILSYRENMKEEFFRIGSKFSTSETFKSRLLTELIQGATTRNDVRNIIKKHRIVVATVASMIGKKDLFQLQDFDRVIIDEASQITETMLCGLLPLFSKVLMIGDHKQLPAVTIQNESHCLVHDEALKALGIQDLRTSLFERFFFRFKNLGYNYAYAQLSHQGRMHEDIMEFPNQQFYEGTLNILPKEIKYHLQQKEALPEIQDSILSQRVCFIPIKGKQLDLNDKTNEEEAQMAVEIIERFQQIYGDEFDFSSVGIITPFRAQIACIREELNQKGINPNDLTIDTVERYQGGARKIIIISVCANTILQLDSIVSSKNNETLDRKLNVALTRAKNHLVVIGNPEILNNNNNYKTFIELYSISNS